MWKPIEQMRNDRPARNTPVKKIIDFSEEMIAAVESWRAKKKPVPNLSEAIRRLVELGLKAKGK
jgi:hypothetical protein